MTVLNATRITLAEAARNVWVVDAQPGSTREDLQNPVYWSHIATRLRPMDHLEVRADDGSWWAMLLVLRCDRAWAKVKEVQFVNLTTPDVALSDDEDTLSDYDVEFKGPRNLWRVVRKSDGNVLQERLTSKEEAWGWVANHKRELA